MNIPNYIDNRIYNELREVKIKLISALTQMGELGIDDEFINCIKIDDVLSNGEYIAIVSEVEYYLVEYFAEEYDSDFPIIRYLKRFYSKKNKDIYNFNIAQKLISVWRKDVPNLSLTEDAFTDILDSIK